MASGLGWTKSSRKVRLFESVEDDPLDINFTQAVALTFELYLSDSRALRASATPAKLELIAYMIRQ